MDWGNFKTIAAIQNSGGLIEKTDELLASAILSATETTKEIGTEIKVAGVGLGISTFSPEIAATLGLLGINVDETQIDTIGQALILGAGASAANKFVDNFTREREKASDLKKTSKKKLPKLEVETEEEK